MSSSVRQIVCRICELIVFLTHGQRICASCQASVNWRITR